MITALDKKQRRCGAEDARPAPIPHVPESRVGRLFASGARISLGA